jgi:thiol:disulfide interchange protein DsbD
MFGAFDLALPPALATRLNNVGGGGYVGALLMGSVAGFLAAPCTGPVLTGVLVWIAKTQNPYLGAGLLFVYALGVGVPFFLIGVFAVRLPKSGAWMDWVKSAFGVALVALGIAYLRDSFTPIGSTVKAVAAQLGFNLAVGVASAIAFVGVLSGAVHHSFKEPTQRHWKGLGVTAVVVAFLLRMAATPVPALSKFSWRMQFSAEQASAAQLTATLDQAKKDCRPVMIDFFADWCAACKELDHRTYVAPEVAAEAERFVTIKVDGTKDSEVLDKLYEQFGVKGLPTVAFVSPEGKVLEAPKVTGFLPPDAFLAELKKIPDNKVACAGHL